MSHPFMQTPQGVKRVVHGLMREDAASCGASVNSALDFFWQVSEHFQTMSSGTFFREGDQIFPATHEATKALSGAIFVTDCCMVDQLTIDISDMSVVINHKDIACFIEKPDDENPRLATRVYFNAEEKVFLAVGIEYKGKEPPGPFSPHAESRFVRILGVPTVSEQIFETMMSLLSLSIDEPACIRDIYRPLH